MTFQISSISIYNENGVIRTVPFKPGKLNIITGDSRRGKSALLNIVDYCLASKDYVIKGAALRNFVQVFAVTLVKEQRQLFVARPAPAGKAATATTMCVVSQALGAPPPQRTELNFSTPLDIAKDVLSEFSEIDRTVRIPAVRSVTPIPPSVRHALFFCLQKQNEVANPDLLFHSQGEEFLPATIRAMIPYFLGAVDPEQALLENRLRLLRQELAQLEAAVAAARSLSPASGQALALVTEAVEAGLLQPPREGMAAEGALEYLRQAIAESAPTQMPDAGDDPVSALVEQRRGLRERHGRARARIANLKRAAQENNEFLDQAAEQHARLATLNLFTPANTADQVPRCPVCDSHQPQLSQIAEAINRDLGRLEADMTVIGNDTPEINALIAAEEETLQEIRGALGRNQDQLDTLTAGQRAAQGQADASRRAVLVQGRISLFLETSGRQVQGPQVVDRREEVRAKIAELEEAVGSGARDDRLNSFVSRINTKIKDKAVALDLEHKESPIRLDPRGLTIVADTARGPVRLADMGGGENWLGYHVATLLSMHEWFSEQRSPVPRFLILDQPSQVYFPEDAPDSTALAGPDRTALLNLYKTIHSTVEALDGDFQVIVMEHADLDDEPFRSSVEARWRRSNGQALVPQGWITEDIAED
ncbi:DUF3732 domain-containing protein [Streptomyces sp. CFMR 7]|uniref:DUF3732 domain-containing protein n=1 Tax=Streptomyces sp. CFMR 7 TaxID=1649184 RepID=UPI0006BDDD70|nr:DUF3732 domain-containing protein [Streptomyces sp. CFMR 7]ALC29798.1 hypothetical protein ABE83_24120 [Streptomyces sp. CFMR 7]